MGDFLFKQIAWEKFKSGKQLTEEEFELVQAKKEEQLQEEIYKQNIKK